MRSRTAWRSPERRTSPPARCAVGDCRRLLWLLFLCLAEGERHKPLFSDVLIHPLTQYLRPRTSPGMTGFSCLAFLNTAPLPMSSGLSDILRIVSISTYAVSVLVVRETTIARLYRPAR